MYASLQAMRIHVQEASGRRTTFNVGSTQELRELVQVKFGPGYLEAEDEQIVGSTFDLGDEQTLSWHPPAGEWQCLPTQTRLWAPWAYKHQRSALMQLTEPPATPAPLSSRMPCRPVVHPQRLLPAPRPALRHQVCVGGWVGGWMGAPACLPAPPVCVRACRPAGLCRAHPCAYGTCRVRY